MSDSDRIVARVIVCGSLVIPLSAFVGQVLSVPILYKWAFEPGMAVNTALCFVMLSMAILVMTKNGSKK